MTNSFDCIGPFKIFFDSTKDENMSIMLTACSTFSSFIELRFSVPSVFLQIVAFDRFKFVTSWIVCGAPTNDPDKNFLNETKRGKLIMQVSWCHISTDKGSILKGENPCCISIYGKLKDFSLCKLTWIPIHIIDRSIFNLEINMFNFLILIIGNDFVFYNAIPICCKELCFESFIDSLLYTNLDSTYCAIVEELICDLETCQLERIHE